MKKLSIIISVLVVFLISGCQQAVEIIPEQTTQDSEQPDLTPPETPEESGEVPETEPEVTEPEPAPESEPTLEPEPESTIKEFDMIARQWAFDPETIIVNEGDTVILHITSVDVTHGFKLSAFGISEELREGETIDIEFVADQKGTFNFRCHISCGSGHSGMDGQLIVE